MRAKTLRRPIIATLTAAICSVAVPGSAADNSGMDPYGELVQLFGDWREFERPPLTKGAPDYRARTLVKMHRQLKVLQERLQRIDRSGWPIEKEVDWHLVRAEMNGMDFNIRVLKPWQRDPAFYTSVWTAESDTPAHEGPVHHALLELWTYSFPLSEAEATRLISELRVIPPLLAQARGNLTGNARDLWVAGTKNIRDQLVALDKLAATIAGSSRDLTDAVQSARAASAGFIDWLEMKAPSKTGPSGVGKENYTWHLRNVHLVPMTWEEEVVLLKRELDRAHASLRLEEHRNRELPPLVSIESPEEYDRRANESVSRYMEFLETRNILPVTDYMDPAIRARIGQFVPKETRNFFWTAVHLEPTTLWTHFYHWFDLARMHEEPHASPIRRGPLLYNIFDSRAEGLATGVEEMMLQAGLYDDNPRAREIVYIMLAQRAARGLGSLYAHANEMTMAEAAEFHVDWTPRGWMRKDLDLLQFEQHLYMRQPGYGSSYVTGKYLIERLLAERGKQLGEKFVLSDFYDELNGAGVIPVSLIRWQLTGLGDEIAALHDFAGN